MALFVSCRGQLEVTKDIETCEVLSINGHFTFSSRVNLPEPGW